MEDNWESLEDNEIILPQLKLKKTTEQMRRLEERRLVEAADNKLTSELFSPINYSKKYLEISNNDQLMKNKKKYKMPFIVKPEKDSKIKSTFQMLNEQKRKDLSELKKMFKAERKREFELYGKTDYDNDYKYDYSHYEDKYT